MGPEETEKSLEEIVGMIKQGDLSLAPKLYEQTKGIICYVVWREWRREHIRRGAKARGMEVEDLLQEGYFSSTIPPGICSMNTQTCNGSLTFRSTRWRSWREWSRTDYATS